MASGKALQEVDDSQTKKSEAEHETQVCDAIAGAAAGGSFASRSAPGRGMGKPGALGAGGLSHRAGGAAGGFVDDWGHWLANLADEPSVEAAAVTPTDCAFRSGKPHIVRLFAGLRRPRSPILGDLMAGWYGTRDPRVLRERLADGGALVVSGLLADRWEASLPALVPLGVERVVEEQGWVAIVLR